MQGHMKSKKELIKDIGKLLDKIGIPKYRFFGVDATIKNDLIQNTTRQRPIETKVIAISRTMAIIKVIYAEQKLESEVLTKSIKSSYVTKDMLQKISDELERNYTFKYIIDIILNNNI